MNRYPKPRIVHHYRNRREYTKAINIRVSDSFSWSDTPVVSYFIGLFLNLFPVNSWNIDSLPVLLSVGLLGDGLSLSDSVTKGTKNITSLPIVRSEVFVWSDKITVVKH